MAADFSALFDGSEVRAAWSADAVREAERATGELLTDGTLMRRAARGVADEVKRVVRMRAAQHVVVLVGPGNNGGDALFAAADLAGDGIRSTIVLVAEKAHEAGLAAVQDAGLDVLHGSGPGGPPGAVVQAVARADVLVDGILGIGARPGDEPPWQALLDAVRPETFVIAVDCPTPGVTADATVTFGMTKTTHLLHPGETGAVTVVDIGLGALPESLDAVRLTVHQLAEAWPVPGPADHKYTRGVVGVATGSDAYPGAAVLGCVAAATAGTGMVRYVGPSRPSAAVLAAVPEAVHGVGRVQAWVVGSGIDGPAEQQEGSERYTSAMQALGEDAPVVADAGALAWLTDDVRPDGSVTVVTPHAGELASLLSARGIDADRTTIEADPVTWARRAVEATGYTVVLKGGVTVVAGPDAERVLVENRAPHWLATAGTGDVLAAVVGVLLAAGLPPERAGALAAYVHGHAGRLANPGGPVRALDVATHLGDAVRDLLAHRGPRKGDLPE